MAAARTRSLAEVHLRPPGASSLRAQNLAMATPLELKAWPWRSLELETWPKWIFTFRELHHRELEAWPWLLSRFELTAVMVGGYNEALEGPYLVVCSNEQAPKELWPSEKTMNSNFEDDEQ
ncbi:hypothetical protein NL676_023084 [Syzygium grande]|nr:hypothetical protein NL676_023084 [Syzygium grande]